MKRANDNARERAKIREARGLARRLRKRCSACWGEHERDHLCWECQQREEAAECIRWLLELQQSGS